ncbi:hypothetical protein TNCT_390931 [Trichonephila clavata]|uniref:PorT family protein n=1 Tax=Trichonephila clavata TaxID=2740835 RepID=A0A8X6LAI4_TRICU|nr:hypothetical protein TNCT_390931 [Trichonephila clavata]
MKYFEVLFFFVISLACSSVLGQFNIPLSRMFQPQFKLAIDGGGNGLKNLHTGVNLGLGLKLYENKKKNISLDLLLSYAQKLSHIDGQLIRGKPVFGLGGTFRWGRK